MSERISQAGQTHSMELIFFPLIILILVGLIANSFSSSAIQTAPVLPTPFCTGNIEPGECYPTNLNGCDSGINPQCNFTTSTKFSFLAINSPFTQLLTGNVLGFVLSAFTQSETQNSYQTGETLCVPFVNGALINATGQTITGFQCAGQVSYGDQQSSTVLPLLNATSNIGNASLYYLTGCPNMKNVTCNNNGISSNGQYGQANDNFFYKLNGTVLTTGQCNVSGVVYSQCGIFWRIFDGGNTPTFTCPNFNGSSNVGHQKYYNSTLVNMHTSKFYCLIPYNSQASANLGNTFSVIGFIFGFLLLIMGLGITIAAQVAATGFTLGANDQGAKLAQVMGLGLIVWTFVYGEFGQSWLPFLPFNLSIIGFITFTSMFFMGLYWRTFSTFD